MPASITSKESSPSRTRLSIKLSPSSRKPSGSIRRTRTPIMRGYCHLLAAVSELLLAVDGRNAFECSAHLLFEKVDTPYTFLLENRRAFDDAGPADVPLWSDVISFFHQ